MPGFFDFLTSPLRPKEDIKDPEAINEYDAFLLNRDVKKEKWDYDYKKAYQFFIDTGEEPYDFKSKKWLSKFKHPLSEERYIKDKDKWYDTIQNKYVPKDTVAFQEMKRSEYLKEMPIIDYEKR
jgi:hypothetical protein